MELVLDFFQDGESAPIDFVSEVTGLTYEEIRSSYQTLDTTEH